ncbi:hypothetical protein Gpo141_00006059 [Globisporangium polare]
MRIWKAEGCNHIKCTGCRFEFCWVCAGVWRSSHYACYERRLNGLNLRNPLPVGQQLRHVGQEMRVLGEQIQCFGQEMRHLWLFMVRVFLFLTLLVVVIVVVGVGFLVSVFGIEFIVKCICCNVIAWAAVVLTRRYQHQILIAVEWLGE